MAVNKGGRPSGAKTRCGGQWTEARYRSFIKSTLRSATTKWGPIAECLRLARTRRGYYRCAICLKEVTASIITTLVNRKQKRVKNAIVDHIKPIVDPHTGFTTWDDVIENMFCELDNLQCVCHACHKAKCAEEAAIAKDRRASEKLEVDDDE